MSEAITIGIAIAAAKGICAAVRGASQATCKAIIWISDKALKEMEQLEKELNDVFSVNSFLFDACNEFEKRYAYIKEKMTQNSLSKDHKDSLAQVLALRNSTLDSFVSRSQWNQLENASVNRKSFKNILNQATKSYAQANAKFISQSIIDVASENGFKQQRVNRYKDGTRFLTLLDKDGRAVVAKVTEAKSGAQIHLDLTGFGDQSCHQVMDSVLEGLKRKQIVFDQLQRRSHYCRQGEKGKIKIASPNKVNKNSQNTKKDQRRRRIHPPSYHKTKKLGWLIMENEKDFRLVNSADPLLKAIGAGHTALFVTGNLYDFTIADDKIVYRPQHIAEQLYNLGYLVIRYSKSQGGRIHNYTSLNPKEKQAVDSLLNGVGLLPLSKREGQNNPEEVQTFFRACSRLLQIPNKDNKPIAVIVDYTEHLAPMVQTSAAATEEHTFVAETLHNLANSPALKKSNNLLICLVRDGLQNTLLNDLQRVEYSFPDESLTYKFIQLVLKSNKNKDRENIRFENDFSDKEFARLTRGLRLRDIEAILRETSANNIPLSRDRVLAAKAEAVLKISEGTLAVMSNNLKLGDIIGLKVIKRFFTLVAEKLKNADPSSPRTILMVGPPGTSKSTFAPILAKVCGFNIVEFQNVKNMYVGESERRMGLALKLIENLEPTVLFIDEITEMIPSRNRSVSNDEISRDLLGQLLKFGSKDELRGKVLLLAASNVPERLDPAWLDRFIIIPFLELLPNEMCKLFGVFEKRVTGKATIDSKDSKIIEASEVLHRKSASPRKVLDIVNHALLFSQNGELSPEYILSAANDYVGSANPMAVAYTSLVAISLTSFYSFLPWRVNPDKYTYPWYLEGVVDRKTGNINREELYKRIEEYRKHTNL